MLPVMEANVRILFLYNRSQETAKAADAYKTRMDGLRSGLDSIGIPTGLLSLRELGFNRPHLAFPLNAGTIARRAEGFNAIHAGGAGATVAAAAARSRHSHLVIFDAHGDESLETRLEWQANPTPRGAFLVLQAIILSTLALRMADVLVTVSEPFRQHYLKKGVPAERVIIARNGADTSAITPVLPGANGRINVCYAGGFQAWQAIDTLIEGFAQANEERLRLHLIGFSPDDQVLKGTIGRRFAERVTLEDWMPKQNLIERLTHADVLIIPRTTHRAMRGGLPSKFAEYLAVGRPVIVTNTDETASFVSQHGCGLVSEPTAEGLSGAIRQAASWSKDEREAMGERARRLAESVFDWRSISREYIGQVSRLAQSKEKNRG